jgi:AraC family L-rhamnose operon transcriptional activator RhaR/AraC family L-rhamnose operon regulatory protein RhaS
LLKAERIVEQIEQEETRKDTGYAVLLYSHLLELMVFLSRAYTESEVHEANSLLRVSNVIGALEGEFAYNWSLAELLDIAHMSKSNFMRVFRKATGHTPLEYLQHVRIHQAMSLLKKTNWSMMQVAVSVGFSDSNYFARQFKKISGMSPTQFRTL